MKTNRFFNVAAIIFSVATSFFCTSCSDDEDDEQTNMYVHDQQQNNGPIYTYVEIADNIADFFDLKATYEYEDGSVVDDLVDKNEFIETTRINKKGEELKLNLKKYDYTNMVGTRPLKVTVTATPQPDAIARVEAMPDDATFDYYIICVVQEKQDILNINNGITRGGFNNFSKANMLRMLSDGERTLNVKFF